MQKSDNFLIYIAQVHSFIIIVSCESILKPWNGFTFLRAGIDEMSGPRDLTSVHIDHRTFLVPVAEVFGKPN